MSPGDANTTGNFRQGIGYLEQILPSGAIGRGGSGLWPSFSTWYAGARALGGYAQAGATHERCAGPDGTPIDTAA
jgi:hypothetical protein